MKRPFSRDRMNAVAPRRIGNAAMDVLTSLQVRFTSEEQVLAAAAVFLILAERFNVPAQDAFTVVKNVMLGAEQGMHPEFRAARAYADNEL